MIIWIVKYVESLTWLNLNKPFCDSYKIHIRLLQISPLDFYAIAHIVLIFKFELSILTMLVYLSPKFFQPFPPSLFPFIYLALSGLAFMRAPLAQARGAHSILLKWHRWNLH